MGRHKLFFMNVGHIFLLQDAEKKLLYIIGSEVRFGTAKLFKIGQN